MSTCAGRDTFYIIILHFGRYGVVLTRLFALAGFMSWWRRISDPLVHALFLLFSGMISPFARVHPHMICACACVCEKWAVHKVVIILFLPYPPLPLHHAAHINAETLLHQTHPLCLRWLSASELEGEWRSEPLLQWRWGFAAFFFSPGTETARYARWCNTYKGAFRPIVFNIFTTQVADSPEKASVLFRFMTYDVK